MLYLKPEQRPRVESGWGGYKCRSRISSAVGLCDFLLVVYSTVTWAIYYAVSEILWWKLPNSLFYFFLYIQACSTLKPSHAVDVAERCYSDTCIYSELAIGYRTKFDHIKIKSLRYSTWNRVIVYIWDSTSACDWRTDGRTDGFGIA